MNDYKFGNFLCRLREKNGMTQAQLAQMLDVTAAAVSKWENGESKPRIETLFALAQILKNLCKCKQGFNAWLAFAIFPFGNRSCGHIQHLRKLCLGHSVFFTKPAQEISEFIIVHCFFSEQIDYVKKV